MTIASAIQAKQQQVADAYTAISNKGGTLPATQDLANMPNAISSINTVNNNTLTVTPTTSQQTFNVSGGYTGYNPVKVNAVTSAIDSDIIATNIKSGVNILGVNGSVVELAGETRNVSITSTSGNTFTPSSGKNGITSIKVTPTNQNRTVTPTTSQQTLSVNSGYSGNGTITVNAVTSSIDANITAGNIKSGISILGVNGTLQGASVNINNYLVRTNNNIELLTKDTYILGSEDTIINAESALYMAYMQISTISNVSLKSIITVSGTSALQYCFYGCSSLTDIDLSSLTTVSGSSAMEAMFYSCKAINNLDLSSLTTVSGTRGISSLLNQSSITNLDLSSLTTVSGSFAMNSICYECKSLESADLSNLSIISGSNSLSGAFYSCLRLTTLSFPSLTSTSFGSYTSQFSRMLMNVTGCTVHFPSNLQSVIGSWSDVTAGFGGTRTTVLFDLTATT